MCAAVRRWSFIVWPCLYRHFICHQHKLPLSFVILRYLSIHFKDYFCFVLTHDRFFVVVGFACKHIFFPFEALFSHQNSAD